MSITAESPAVGTQSANSSPAAEPVRDSINRVWDATKFKTNPDGSPRLDSIKRFVSLTQGKRGKTGGVTTGGDSQPGTSQPPPSFDDVEKAARAAVATNGETTPEDVAENMTAETVIGILQTALVLIGEDEGVLSPQEKELLRRPLVRVLAKYNVSGETLPPEADLALALAVIVVTRLRKPKTASFVVRLKTWFQGHVLARRVQRVTNSVSVEGAKS